ncbi:MAG: hypothetical protein NVSMB32_09770 [Actinomycetota bacterium]
MSAPAVVELRRARRHRRLQKFNLSEALYRGYLTAIGVAAGVWVLSNLPKDHRLTAAQVHNVAQHGPALVGLLVALGVALALRSGARGGPLVLEAPDIQHVLLAPLVRRRSLLAPAIQRVRTTVLGWAGAGAVAGVLASKRLPGPPLEWLACGLAAGALTGAATVSMGLLASGRRLPRRWAFVGALAVLGWAVADLATHAQTSPFSIVGRVAVYPLGRTNWAWLVAIPIALVLAAGLVSVGGVSLEAAMRRASLVGQLRFALTVRDLRTVVVLSRLLAEERPRRRPVVRLRPGSGRFWTVWKRDWQGLLRWPLSRLVRSLVLAAIAGAALRGVWAGTTPLLAVAGIALWLAAMDADVGLAGEVDHSDRSKLVPFQEGDLLLRHLPAAVVVVGLLAVVGGISGAQLGGWSRHAVVLGVFIAVPATVAAVAGAAVSAVRSVYGSGSLLAFSPESTGITLVLREALPPAIATAGLVPLWAARHLAKAPALQISTAISWSWLPLLLAGCVALWLSHRGLK